MKIKEDKGRKKKNDVNVIIADSGSLLRLNVYSLLTVDILLTNTVMYVER